MHISDIYMYINIYIYIYIYIYTYIVYTYRPSHFRNARNIFNICDTDFNLPTEVYLQDYIPTSHVTYLLWYTRDLPTVVYT